MALVAVACSSDSNGSGVSPNKTIASLSATDLRAMCTYFTNSGGPERTITCTDGSTITIGTSAADHQASIDECVTSGMDFGTMYPNCTVTVGDYEACYDDLNALPDDSVCMDTAPPASCAVIFAPTPECGGV